MSQSIVKDIAQLARVSRTVFSRILNDNQSVFLRMGARRRGRRIFDEHHSAPQAVTHHLINAQTYTTRVVLSSDNRSFLSTFFTTIGKGTARHVCNLAHTITLPNPAPTS